MDTHVFRLDPAFLNNSPQFLQGAIQDFGIRYRTLAEFAVPASALDPKLVHCFHGQNHPVAISVYLEEEAAWNICLPGAPDRTFPLENVK